MKVWKIVKKMLPFFGTFPFLRIDAGSILTSASSGNAENELNAWFARMFLSARKRMRGLRETYAVSELVEDRFQRLWKSFYASWKAMNVFPVPVASVSRMRSCPPAIASSTRSMAMSW